MPDSPSGNDQRSVTRRSPQRGDIQGLRAICMAQVLIYHAWNIGSPIGVDSFIMISAFLMTSSFVRRAEAGRTPFFIERWANTFKRLLPPLIIVVFATVWASLRFLPQSRWPEIFDQAKASLTYTQNWRLIDVSTDYFAENSALSSPLQHLWSMSMQGQIFLLWPVIMGLCVLVAKLCHVAVRNVIFTAFALLTVFSLVWLLVWAPNDGSIYFYTRARLWEFSLGSTLAAAAPWFRIKGLSARMLSWIGVMVLLLFCLVSIGEYPGPMAAIPMLAVSTVLLFPSGDHPHGASRFLSFKPLAGIGNISYSVYLIHWPIFIIYLNIIDQESLTLADGTALILLSLLVAWGVTKLVDDPLRLWPWANAATSNKIATAVLAFTIGIVPITLWDRKVIADDQSASNVLDPVEHPGALALAQATSQNYTEDPVPNPESSWTADLPDPCGDEVPDEFSTANLGYCTQVGDENKASVRILSVGSSKLSQFTPAFEQIAQSNNWFIRHSHHSACTWSLDDSVGPACRARNTAALEYIDEFQPDYVILQTTLTTAESPDEAPIPGVEELIQEITAKGIPVIGIRDTIRKSDSILECSLEHPSTSILGGCFLFRPDYQPDENPANTFNSIPGFAPIDLTDQLCIGDLCPTIIGNTYVYVDTMHISNEYVVSLAPVLESRLKEAMG